METEKEGLIEQVLAEQDKSEEEAIKELETAAALMNRAAKDRANRAQILKDVDGVLGKIKISDFPDLVESPAVQVFLKLMGKDDLNPGEVKNKGTLAEREREWTMRDVHAKVQSGEFKLHKFTPNKSMPLTFQGLTIYIKEGEECELPDCFYDIYRDHLKAVKQAEHHVQYLMGQRDDPPDRNYMTPESAYVRAFSKLGKGGQSSGTLTTGRVLTGDEEQTS